MKDLKTVLTSMIETYNKREVINFFDLLSLETLLGKENSLVIDLVNDYNNKTILNFTQVRDIENLTQTK